MLQPTSLTATSAGTTWLSLGYTYSATNNNGNVIQQTTTRQGPGAGSWTQNYGCNESSGLSLNRLTSAAEVNGIAYNYGFDAAGNRWVSSPPTSMNLEILVVQSW